MAKKDILKLLEDKGYTIYSFCKTCGLTRKTFYSMRAGTTDFSNITLKNAIKICNILNCNLSDLIEDKYYQAALEYDKRRCQ